MAPAEPPNDPDTPPDADDHAPRERAAATVAAKLDALPLSPGVYLFKDKRGAVLYVGKAKNLRSRVRSYFQSGGSDTRAFIPFLQHTLADLETVVTGSEKEAMILENRLIKEHKPRFNVKLRDDKEYLSIRLATDHPWPRLTLVRKPADDGVRYFGPYHSATAARRTLHLINKHFQLRTCSDAELASRRRPCLQYQIKRCPAPCVYDVDRAFYAEQTRAVALFLEGRHDTLSEELDVRMKDSARAMRFELAAVYRDQLKAIDAVRQGQRVVSTDFVDRDVLGFYREGDLVEMALLHIRGGMVADVAPFTIQDASIPDDEIVAAFVSQHYGEPAAPSSPEDDRRTVVPVPEEIVLPMELEGEEGIAEWLAERAGKKVVLVFPKRGPRTALLDLANDNARHAFVEKRRDGDDIEGRLADLRDRLRLPTVPRRIECCDISHLGGGDTVGAVVAMRDGVLDKARYRTFHVRGTSGEPGVGDDYGAMYEVLARRFRRGLEERKARADEAAGEAGAGKDVDATREKGEWDLPDLFVVDGGRGQLGVALAAARDLGLHDLAIVGLAKERENVAGETVVDRVYLPGQKNPINLKSTSAALFFLARLRDEAHRSSNRAREKLGKGRRFRSELDSVKGLGPKTRKALLVGLGSLSAIKSASDAELLAVSGVTARHVRILREAFPPSAVPGGASSPDVVVEAPGEPTVDELDDGQVDGPSHVPSSTEP
ncbi:MAG: excinuclease ABC subunit UvrC [Polyangiaceae bacterium]